MVNSERKAALITGAASGMGFETVKRFSKDPRYNPIYALDLDPSVHTIFEAAQYPQVVALQVDIRKGNEIAQVFDKVLKETKNLDVVVNAAGIIIAGDAQGPEGEKQIANLNDTNFFGQMYVMQRAEIAMESREGGVIINVTSAKDYFPDPFRFEYMLSKIRFEEMSLYDGERLREDGVRIVVVKPGNTKTHIDRRDWTQGYNEGEMKAVQGFNDWWRRTFGNDPKNVAEVIYKIAEGEIDNSVVPVGLDAKLGYLLVKIPFWRAMFFLGAAGVYAGIIKLQNLRDRLPFKGYNSRDDKNNF
ncbi:SDR family NAD(P)-dependent oxidoreductase [Candidatus Daviesbacteria bacterium]|nr:SDR family NAD(P)-dependent oxidoreductase [Candidatus Daviesbacteria bacterium]